MDGFLIFLAVVMCAIVWAIVQKSTGSRGGGGAGGFQRIPDRFRTLAQVQENLRQAGLEASQLLLAVDFTKSNEWTGKRSFQGRCLHAEPAPESGLEENFYAHAIGLIARTLGAFDDDNLIPAYGFGSRETGDRALFSFRRRNAASRRSEDVTQGVANVAPCDGLDDVVRRYKAAAEYTELSGPTSFAPAIRQAVQHVIAEDFAYHVLLIIADGQVTNKKATVDAIVEASHYPLSIVLCGVGDGPWDMMEEFDDELPQRQFDNFQFVELNRVMREYAPAQRDAAFAMHCLMELPDQYKFIKKHDLLSPPTGTARRTPPPPVSVFPPPFPPRVEAQFEAEPVENAIGGVFTPSAPALQPTDPTDCGASSSSGASVSRVKAAASAAGTAAPGDDDAPRAFMCPITLCIMRDPVIAADGHSYDRPAIEQWFQQGKTSSPITGALLENQNLLPNHTLRSQILEHLAGGK